MKTTALITGFTGQVGSQMADFILAESDWDVCGMMRWQEPMNNIYHLTDRINRNDRVSVQYADLNDYSSLHRLLNEVRPSFIFHLAAQSFPKTSFDSPLETLQTNILGTANLLEVIRQLKETSDYDPIVHVCSSSEVYGKVARGVHLTEESKFHGTSPYSISKIGTDYLGQFYGEAYRLKTFVTRMGTHSGPRRSDVFFESTLAKQVALIEAGLQDPIVYLGNLSSVRTFQDTRDAVRAYYLLALKSANGALASGETFNIAGAEAFALNEIVEMVLGMTKRSDIEVSTDSVRLRPIDADYQMFDNSKIMKTIDWSPTITVETMLRDLLDHWRMEIKRGNIPLNR